MKIPLAVWRELESAHTGKQIVKYSKILMQSNYENLHFNMVCILLFIIISENYSQQNILTWIYSHYE